MSWATCYSGSNNIHFNLPPLMSDGREYANYDPSCKANNNLRNNLGIKKCDTQFSYILNPDVKLKKNTFNFLSESCLKISDFALISPIHSDEKYPNYKINKKYNYVDENIFEVDDIDGFSMLINKKNFNNNDYFDENFFLYLENNDLCLRIKKKVIKFI